MEYDFSLNELLGSPVVEIIVVELTDCHHPEVPSVGSGSARK